MQALAAACDFAEVCATHARACAHAASHAYACSSFVGTYDATTKTVGTQVEDYIAANAAVTAAALQVAQAATDLSLCGYDLAAAAAAASVRRAAPALVHPRLSRARAPAAAKGRATKRARTAHPLPPPPPPPPASVRTAKVAKKKGQGGACAHCASIHRRCEGGDRRSADPDARVCLRCKKAGKECVYRAMRPKNMHRAQSAAAAAAQS
jgi:hypothetical protein